MGVMPIPSEPSGASTAPPPARPSARAQREACDRLSMPRQPKQQDKHSMMSGGEQGYSEEEMEVADSLQTMLEEQGVPIPVVVPSILSQCQGRLERIDEEAAAAGTDHQRNKARK